MYMYVVVLFLFVLGHVNRMMKMSEKQRETLCKESSI